MIYKNKNKNKMEISIKSIQHKPSMKVSGIEIYGRIFMEKTISPNIFVIETNDNISSTKDLTFNHNNIQYTLSDIMLHDINNTELKMVECRTWEEEYIG